VYCLLKNQYIRSRLKFNFPSKGASIGSLPEGSGKEKSELVVVSSLLQVVLFVTSFGI
jgi:hypothetical protein